MSNNSKVKSLLKGLRFISQIFDSEKEPEIEIGHPTDVKHVAHIGLDGHHPENPSASWMNGFESIGLSSESLDRNGDIHNKGSHHSEKQVTEDSSRRGSSRSVDCHGHDKHLSRSRRQSTGNMRECQAKEKSDKPRQSKKPSSKHSKDSSNVSNKSIEDVDSFQLEGNNNNDLLPKKSHSKLTSKDDSISGGSGLPKSRSRSTTQTKDHNHRSSHSHSRSKQRSFEENAQIERGSNENILKNYPN